MAGENNGKVADAHSRWDDKKVFTTGEAAELCKVSQQTIIRCFDSGRLQGFRVPGSRFRRIPRDELIRFMRDNDIPTDALQSGPATILCVDDDPEILDLYQDAFGRMGNYNVVVASTGYDAGMMTEQHKPDLIVLDYMLPDVNGNVVCERVRAHPELSSTRILFVSGVIDESEVQGLMDAGGDGFLRKPFDLEELMERVNALIGATA
ncbi:MAG: response regulator [Planctomycetota bacterium]